MQVNGYISLGHHKFILQSPKYEEMFWRVSSDAVSYFKIKKKPEKYVKDSFLPSDNFMAFQYVSNIGF